MLTSGAGSRSMVALTPRPVSSCCRRLPPKLNGHVERHSSVRTKRSSTKCSIQRTPPQSSGKDRGPKTSSTTASGLTRPSVKEHLSNSTMGGCWHARKAEMSGPHRTRTLISLLFTSHLYSAPQCRSDATRAQRKPPAPVTGPAFDEGRACGWRGGRRDSSCALPFAGRQGGVAN